MITARRLTCLLAAGAMLPMAGCAPAQYGSPQEAAANACSALGPKALSGALVGGLGGAAGGAAIGAAAGRGRGAAIGAGVGLLAGVIGGLAVGNNLDQRDCYQARIALAQMAQSPAGVPVGWQSPTGSYGRYTPIAAAYQAPGGQLCRRFAQDVVIAGRAPVQEQGVVCRDANGDWQRTA